MEKLLFTSELVTEGHPDKICDRISDAVLSARHDEEVKKSRFMKILKNMYLTQFRQSIWWRRST